MEILFQNLSVGSVMAGSFLIINVNEKKSIHYNFIAFNNMVKLFGDKVRKLSLC